jgi:PAS domain S-box-containing protein
LPTSFEDDDMPEPEKSPLQLDKAETDALIEPNSEVGYGRGLLSAIVDSSFDAIVSKTLDGVITSWNPAAERMFGYTAAEAVGSPITLIIPEERRAEEQIILSRLRRGERIDHFETIRHTKDGRLLNISLTVSPITDSDGRIVGASKIARDITSEKLAEQEHERLLGLERVARQEAQRANDRLTEQLELLQKEVRARQQAQAELAEALEVRDDFIAMAAHELRNPLNVALLTLQLIARHAADGGMSQISAMVERLRTQIGRINRLVERLLDVTRIRAGAFELNRETFDLSDLVKSVTNRFAVENPGLPISLEIEGPIGGKWDRLRLDQVITNLLSNAAKYGDNKLITVSARVESQMAVVKVKDQGKGLSSQDLERIFNRFERLGPRPSKTNLGLGLWITRGIVDAHGGTITAENGVGGTGATFVVRLPLRRPSVVTSI